MAPLTHRSGRCRWCGDKLETPGDTFCSQACVLSAINDQPPTLHRPRGFAPYRPCGTLAAAKRHYRHNEPLCDPCREVQNQQARTWWRRIHWVDQAGRAS